MQSPSLDPVVGVSARGETTRTPAGAGVLSMPGCRRGVDVVVAPPGGTLLVSSVVRQGTSLTRSVARSHPILHSVTPG